MRPFKKKKTYRAKYTNCLNKIIATVVTICLMGLAFVGCEEVPVGEFVPTEEETTTTARFQEIGREKFSTSQSERRIEDVVYYVDIHTNIVYMYFVDRDGSRTCGGITVIYGEDGTPMTLDEFMN